jgi:hypothetical protein
VIRILFLFFCFTTFNSYAQRVSGLVTDTSGNEIPFATIHVKESNVSTTANNLGKYSLQLPKGTYTIICQHVGFQRQQQTISVQDEPIVVNFQLQLQQLTLAEVIVKRGEDPAYEIIRQTIKKRPFYNDELQKFTVQVYTKGQLKLRDFPDKFFGQKVDFEDGDTSKNKMILLTETISRYSVQKPGKSKVEVVASKVSGQSDGFGLSAPQMISFYQNNIAVGRSLNARGFISPIADNALNFYYYKYEGAFFEEGRQISRIRVTPKRKYEPVFSGYLNIVEDDWRIHSLQLQLTKESAMELMDTLRIQQLYFPAGNVWVLKNQVLFPAIKIFGFDAHGSFVNIYSDYDLNPEFGKDFFGNTVMIYTDSSNKKDIDFWESSRPILLQQEELDDYKKKDSIEQLRKDPRYLDSLDRVNNKISISEILLTGASFSKQRKRSVIMFSPLMQSLSYNTVEGTVLNANATISWKLDSMAESRRSFSITPEVRYGFINGHINPNLSTNYKYGKGNLNSISVSGGKDVYQFDNSNPEDVLASTISTLFYEKNTLKIYEAIFATFRFEHGLDKGFRWHTSLQYQDRSPLDNTTSFTFFDKEDREFTPNYPIPLTLKNLPHHQALVITAGVRWQPGVKYIRFPQRSINIGSKYPVFHITYSQAFKNIFSSDVDYGKWNLIVTDNINLKMKGSLSYRFDLGGFLFSNNVQIPDFIHFTGNPRTVTTSYLDRFLLVPHYYFSNVNKFNTAVYAEHHFNGFITNKIPVVNKLKWHLVTGVNHLYMNNDRRYTELLIGLENILKLFRVDYVWGFEKNIQQRSGIRIGIKTFYIVKR